MSKCLTQYGKGDKLERDWSTAVRTLKMSGSVSTSGFDSTRSVMLTI